MHIVESANSKSKNLKDFEPLHSLSINFELDAHILI